MSASSTLRSVVLVWLFLPCIRPMALATEAVILPGAEQYAALESAENCSVTRAVLRHSESDYMDINNQRETYKTVLQQRRKQLEMCAEQKGASLGWDSRSQALLAEVCSEEYESWLYAGSHYRMLSEDTREAVGSIRTLIRHARRECSPLPVSPTVPSSPAIIADTAG